MTERRDRKAAGRDPRRRLRIMVFTIALALATAMALPLIGYVAVDMAQAQEQAASGDNPRADYWRAVREGVQGYSAVQGQEADVLIQNGGQNWRQVARSTSSTR